MGKKKIDWGQWFLYGLGVVVVECVSIYLLRKAYPGQEMKIIGWAILVLVLGFSGYATYKADEPDITVRQVGIGVKVVLALLGVAALYGHIAMSRELSTSREGYAEFQAKVKFQEKIKADRDQREIEKKRAEAEQMAAQARLETAETGKLRLLDPSQRRAVATTKRQSPPAAQGKSDTESPVDVVIAEPKMESAVREEWLDYFQAINLLQILISVLGALGVSVARHWDRKGIRGVPDWIERVWFSGVNGRQYIQANYEQYVPLLNAPFNAQEPAMGN